MRRVLTALKQITKFLTERHFRYAVIGGLAAGVRGQPRTTNDVDISLWVELGHERTVIDAVLGRFAARIEDAAAYALSYRILVIEASNGVPIDLALATFPFEEEMLDRASLVELEPKLLVNVLSPEDLVVTKVLAGRPIDWFDVQGVFDRLGPQLDFAVIVSRLQQIGELVDLQDAIPRLNECLRKSTDLGDIELA